ncbi:hypothetical protein EVAR_76373_1 [Eumeta japonica]|uniref:Uncharacterized protein n=1 Tax=Eumeta variegata TaxID=151549 RepID=A0A4C1T8K0_EUMVA|nr:hypothetical protein EVAR_76373_1 [Eumeta japonica]
MKKRKIHLIIINSIPEVSEATLPGGCILHVSRIDIWRQRRELKREKLAVPFVVPSHVDGIWEVFRSSFLRRARESRDGRAVASIMQWLTTAPAA